VQRGDLGIQFGAPLRRRARTGRGRSTPLVVARTRHLQQFTHPLDRVAGLLPLDHSVSFYRLRSETKKAAAFFKNSRFKRNSAFFSARTLQLCAFIGIKHPASIASRGRLALKAHPTTQQLFTDTDLGGHMRYRSTGLILPARPAVPPVRCPPSGVNPKGTGPGPGGGASTPL
jgi:hypothetical protein